MPHPRSCVDAVVYALNNPIGSDKFSNLVRRGQTVVIITSDISRSMPTWQVLPSVLEELYRGGIQKEDITSVFALGSHRHHTEKEMRHLAGATLAISEFLATK